MVQRIVTHYFAQWDVNNHNGVIRLYQQAPGFSSQVAEFGLTNPEEFRVVVDLLRNETPVAFEDIAMQLRVGHGFREPVGEEET